MSWRQDPPKLLKGGTSLEKKVLPTEKASEMCISVGFGSGQRENMHNDSPENASLEV